MEASYIAEFGKVKGETKMTDQQKFKILYTEIDVLIAHQVTIETPEFIAWKLKVTRILKKLYGKDSDEITEFENTKFSPMIYSITDLENKKLDIRACADGLQVTKLVFKEYIEEFNDLEVLKKVDIDKNMKKKYQVFISSTYEDLKEERAAVIQCLLDNDCIPVGMEQFPSSNMSQMEYIKKMLDDCDYYILIVGGRYGSLDDDGTGYTEKEYNYALQKKIPVMAFVFDHPEELPNKKCEQTDTGKEKFITFRNRVWNSKRLVKGYSDIGDLKAKVITAVIASIRDYPAVGWVRGDSIPEIDENESDEVFKKKLAKHIATDEEVQSMFNEIFDKDSEK